MSNSKHNFRNQHFEVSNQYRLRASHIFPYYEPIDISRQFPKTFFTTFLLRDFVCLTTFPILLYGAIMANRSNHAGEQNSITVSNSWYC